ncbi:hypothetical protein EYF80_042860 [Liparis tanakae]|uniref:Uncharacterized protein n=1 Tax=Liparis tanakae TaxID=230148 RepID=A0A4Z2G274_9TELE|nr:hypothetical protein EYF80_042860 [Liparis tanakae]
MAILYLSVYEGNDAITLSNNIIYDPEPPVGDRGEPTASPGDYSLPGMDEPGLETITTALITDCQSPCCHYTSSYSRTPCCQMRMKHTDSQGNGRFRPRAEQGSMGPGPGSITW